MSVNTIIFRAKYVKALSVLEPEKRLEAYDAIMTLVFTKDRAKTSEVTAPVVRLIYESICEDYNNYKAKENYHNE